MEIEEKLSALKIEIDRANQEVMRSELAREAALAARDASLEKLKQFDVSSIDEAKLKLQSLEEELIKALDDAAASIHEIQKRN